MITHAYVHYQDDLRCAVVKIEDVKGFKADDDFRTAFYNVKWTEDECEDDLKRKMKSGRARVRRMLSRSESEESDKDIAMQGPAINCWRYLQQKRKSSEKKTAQSKKTQLSAAQEVARLSSTVKQQEEELKELRALCRELQRKLLDSLDCMQGKELFFGTDIGSGVEIASSAWRRIQTNTKDSVFVKNLLTAVWSPAELLGRSLQGKHSPRCPDRPRKEPLSPWKLFVIRGE
ncbi:uncharacterized protein [Dermacentor andersoni]|uniref:uncharacterized protein n=1 Tax=Dermacentor andersoni TaxID=34620 RepID=UPI003B3A74EA